MVGLQDHLQPLLHLRSQIWAALAGMDRLILAAVLSPAARLLWAALVVVVVVESQLRQITLLVVQGASRAPHLLTALRLHLTALVPLSASADQVAAEAALTPRPQAMAAQAVFPAAAQAEEVVPSQAAPQAQAAQEGRAS
jgi:hypothetical protein